MKTDSLTFGSFRLIIARGELFEGDKKIVLGWRAMAILTLLAERAGVPVSREDLIRRAWPNIIVEENNLRVQISAIRKALGEGSGDFKFIQNIPGYGYQFCLERQPALQVSAANTRRLPSVLTPLVGRQTELAHIASAISLHRVIVLTGPGGAGKTSLAIAAAHSLAPAYPDGTGFFNLSPLTSVAAVHSMLSDYANAAAQSQSSGPDGRMLWVLDRCDHLASGAGPMLDALLSSQPLLDIVMTSRIPLSCRHGTHYRVGPLACPPVNVFPFSIDDALQYPAAQLFVERARAAAPEFVMQSSDGNALAEICAHLDGLPLAIELAAIRTGSMDLRSLSIQLRKSAAILTRGSTANLVAGQASVQALDSSYDLLTETEQRILTRLSIFRARFSTDAAFAVASEPGLEKPEFLAIMASLADKSVLLLHSDASGETCQIPRVCRAWLYAKLIAATQADTIQQRHAQYLHEHVSRLTPGRKRVQREEIAGLYGVVEEIRAALDWCFGTHGNARTGLELLVAAAHLWCHVSQFSEYFAVGMKALEVTAAQNDVLAEPRMRLSIALGFSIYSINGSTQTMHDLLVGGLNIASERNDLFWKSLALRGLWKYFHGRSEQEAAMASASASLQVARAAKTGSSHATLKGASCLYQGSLKRARRYLDYAVRISDPFRQAHLSTDQSDQRVFDLCMHARLLWQTGDFSTAIDIAESCLQDVLEKGRPVAIVAALSLAVCPIYCWSDNAEMAEQRLRMLEQYAALYEMDHWSRYGEVFRLGQSLPRIDVPGVRAKTNVIARPWSQRHIEEFSVLRNGFVPPALLTTARSDKPVWCSAENLRAYAARRHFQPGSDGQRYSHQLLLTALHMARRQGATGWELRISLTLGQMLQQQDRPQEARALLESVLEKTRGHTVTADQMAARSFVEGHHPLPDPIH